MTTERKQTAGSFWNTPGPHRLDVLCLAALTAICLMIGIPRYRWGIDLGDEGSLAYGAQRVLEGQIPHRDFVSIQPPLSFYAVAVIFKLLGTSLASMRTFGLLLYLFIPLLIYSVSRHFVGPWFSLMAGAPATFLGMPYFNFVPFAVWQGITATLISTLLFLRALTGTRHRGLLAFASGTFLAAAIFLRHDQGSYIGLSMAVCLFGLWLIRDQAGSGRTARFTGVWIMAGMAAVAVPGVIYWLMRGALGQMFEQLIVFPVRTYAHTSSVAFPSFSTPFFAVHNVIVTLYFVPPLAVITGISCLLTPRRGVRFRFEDVLFLFVLVWAGMYYCQVLVRSDLDHLLITLPPALVLAAISCGRIFRGVKAKSLVGIVAPVATLGFAVLTKPVFLPQLPKTAEIVAVARGGVRDETAPYLTRLMRDVQQQTAAKRTILCLPYQPMFYFLAERRNPTRWNCLWPGDQTAADHDDLVRQAKADSPDLALIVGEEVMNTYAPGIIHYIRTEFKPVATNGELVVYLPR